MIYALQFCFEKSFPYKVCLSSKEQSCLSKCLSLANNQLVDLFKWGSKCSIALGNQTVNITLCETF